MAAASFLFLKSQDWVKICRLRYDRRPILFTMGSAARNDVRSPSSLNKSRLISDEIIRNSTYFGKIGTVQYFLIEIISFKLIDS